MSDEEKIKIVFVDDEDEVVDLYTEYLKNTNYTVFGTSDVDQAVSFIEKNGDHVAMTIADMNMPGSTGLQLREKLLDKYEEVPFALISGFCTDEIMEEGKKLGIQLFLDKNTRPELLLEKVKKTCEDRVDSIFTDEEIKEAYIEESLEMTEDLEQLILDLGKSPGAGNDKKIFRLIHTIKGGSSFLKCEEFSTFIHKWEDGLGVLKEVEESEMGRYTGDMLKSLDVVKESLRFYQEHGRLSSEEYQSIWAGVYGNRESSSSAPEKNPSSDKSAEMVKVPIPLLDEFMVVCGNLVVQKNMINKLISVLDKRYSQDKSVQHLGTILIETYKNIGNLQNKIEDLRKFSVSVISKSLKRAVRELSVALNKSVVLNIKGDDLRVDFNIYEVLNKSLLHMIRNSIDHGLEDKKTRTDAGKPQSGTVNLSFAETRGHIEITIKDDGRGIDKNIIVSKALDSGVIDKGEAEQLSEEQIYDLIFAPGFSTSKTVSDISGRGVGMDMVKTSVTAIGGTIRTESEPGIGTKFQLRLPKQKSASILDTQAVTIAGTTVVIPQKNIERIFRYHQEDSMIASENLEVLLVGGESLDIIDLGKILGSGEDLADREFGVAVRFRGKKFGFLVDEIGDSEEVVRSDLLLSITKKKVFSACAIMGDDTIGLMLDFEGLISENFDRIQENEQQPAGESSTDADEPQTRDTDTEMHLILISVCESVKIAVRMEQLVRLETVKVDKIRVQGNLGYMVYNDKSTAVIDISGALNRSRKAFEGMLEDEETILIMSEYQNGMSAFPVNSVDDILTVHKDEVLDLNDPISPFVQGAVFPDQVCYFIIDLYEYAANFYESDLVDQGRKH